MLPEQMAFSSRESRLYFLGPVAISSTLLYSYFCCTH
jgi:hypothetical protein